jgi:hypothetical protein
MVRQNEKGPVTDFTGPFFVSGSPDYSQDGQKKDQGTGFRSGNRHSAC